MEEPEASRPVKMVAALKKEYNNPNYYPGWFLRQMQE